jgi:sugar O-acyltransferase (sialic acid O-acetyltransferase NeuD family)
MPKRLVVFGFGELGELAHHYFTTDSDYDVVAFTLDRAYISQPEFCGLPLIPFDEVTRHFPPAENSMFVALGYSRVNQLRREKYFAAKAAGYELARYVSSRATVLNGGAIGDNCFILEHNIVQPFSRVGNNVTMWGGSHLGHHSVVADHCFLASHIVVAGAVQIGESCFVGINATLRDHIKVGEKCVIGAGALLLSDAAPEGVYLGEETERSRVPSTRLRRI